MHHRPPLRLRDVTVGIGSALRESTPALSPDGLFAVVSVQVPEGRGVSRSALVRVALTTGERRTLLDEPGQEYSPGPVSPDSTRVVVVVGRQSTPKLPPQPRLAVLDLDTGELTDVATDWDRWARPVAWLPGGGSTCAWPTTTAGACPVFRVEVSTGEVHQVTHDDAAYSDLVVAPELRAGQRSPPRPRVEYALRERR